MNIIVISILWFIGYVLMSDIDQQLDYIALEDWLVGKVLRYIRIVLDICLVVLCVIGQLVVVAIGASLKVTIN